MARDTRSPKIQDGGAVRMKWMGWMGGGKVEMRAINIFKMTLRNPPQFFQLPSD